MKGDGDGRDRRSRHCGRDDNGKAGMTKNTFVMFAEANICWRDAHGSSTKSGMILEHWWCERLQALIFENWACNFENWTYKTARFATFICP